jgi:hypothetical protein
VSRCDNVFSDPVRIRCGAQDALFLLDVIQIKTKYFVRNGDELLMNYGPGMLSSNEMMLTNEGFRPIPCGCPLHERKIITEPLWLPDHRVLSDSKTSMGYMQHETEMLFKELTDRARSNRRRLGGAILQDHERAQKLAAKQARRHAEEELDQQHRLAPQQRGSSAAQILRKIGLFN